MKELVIDAQVDKLNEVMAFISEQLESLNCSMKATMQIEVAVEEIFVNIANYAYAPESGQATIQVEVINDPQAVVITFIDSGREYNPLAKDDPDVTLNAQERQIGGLGIFMVKKSMDQVDYKYEGGKNIFSIMKNL